MSELRILLVGGGSGGHIYPLVAVAQSLREQASSRGIKLELLMLGDSGFLKKAAEENSIPYKLITAGKLRRYSSIQSVIDLLKIPLSLIQSFWHIFIFMPDVVFVKGGYASVPPAVIAKLFFIPVYLHETDSIPGLANVFLGSIVRKVFISFKIAEKHFDTNKVVYTGNPFRKKLLQGNKEEAKKYFELIESRPTILILGGSQGAQIINEVVVSSLVIMTQKYNIIHVCGEGQFQPVKNDVDVIIKEGTQQYATPVKVYYRPYPFLSEKEMSLAYALADIIITRAGGALFELSQLGKPVVVIPISQSASNHQYFNAFEFSLYGGHLIEEASLNRESLLHEIERLLNPETYAKIADKIKKFTNSDAADKIASELLK